MPFRCKCLIVLLSLTLAQAADKEEKFTAGKVTDYEARQTVDKVTIAAAPYTTEELSKKAFGKANPYKYGVLPVLLVVQNDKDQTVDLQSMQVALITPDRDKVEATPAGEVKYLSGTPKPDMTPGPIPGRGPRVGRRKGPLTAWEIEGRSFSAKMLPPKESASGFFYFQAPLKAGSSLYITGLREAQSGKELFYFEIRLN